MPMPCDVSSPTPPYPLPVALVYREWRDGDAVAWSLTRDLGHGVTRGIGGNTAPTPERWEEVVQTLTTEGE